MALFQRNPYENTQHQSLFTLGMNKTVLIVGLGNPGKKYDGTRHNAGFMCLDHFAEAHTFDPWVEKKDMKCQLASKTLGDTRVILCKPTTFMNLSGEAVQKVAHFYKVAPENIVLVHDELDVPFGQIRIRMGGSSAGHNGVEDIIKHLGNSSGRVRIGIDGDRGNLDGADYVLAKFSPEEQGHLTAMTRETTSILTEYIFQNNLVPETRTFII